MKMLLGATIGVAAGLMLMAAPASAGRHHPRPSEPKICVAEPTLMGCGGHHFELFLNLLAI